MKESILRTLVPIIYALLIKAGLGQLGVDDATVQALATLVATGALYVALRVAERRVGALGWLLGYAKQPVYVDSPVPTAKVTVDLSPLEKQLREISRDIARLTKAPARKAAATKPTTSKES